MAHLDTDTTLFRIAARQHGVVSRRQLLAAGVPAHALEYRIRKGRLRPIHRGVYRVGPVEAPHHREMAAVLACGDRAALSHRTAAVLWEMVPRPREGAGKAAPVEITAPRSLRGPRKGVRLHRTGPVEPDEVGEKHGLSLTLPARTLLDLASRGRERQLERAPARAERAKLVTRADLDATLARHPTRRGGSTLRALLGMTGGPALTRSEAEAHFLELVRKGSLPRPASNVIVEGLEVDFLWHGARLVVEIDGFAYHGGRTAFECDRRRSASLAAAGLTVMRITWRQLTEEPESVLVRLAQALVLRSPNRGRSEAR